jgi:hypothetical protein
MDWVVRTIKRAQPKLRKWFERLSPREWIVYGALPWAQRPFDLVTRTEESLHEFAPEALRLLSTYEHDEARAARWATHRCLAPGSTQAFTPLQ